MQGLKKVNNCDILIIPHFALCRTDRCHSEIYISGGLSINMIELFTMAIAYLLGSFPTAYILGRLFKKFDIREFGSGNVGAVNIYRAPPLTVLIDIAKGALAVGMAINWSENPLVVFMAGLLVLLGHNYSIFLRFKGGKGLATGLGVLIALSPSTIPFILLTAVVLTILLKDTNTAFGSSALSIPVILLFQYQQLAWVLFGLALAAIIIVKHGPDYRAYREGRRKLV